MLGFLIRWVVMSVAVFVAANIRFLGISYDDGTSLAAAALVLGILNTFVRPLLLLFTLPWIVLSLGLLVLVINATLFYAVAWLVHGFHVTSFWSALGGSIVVSLISLLFGTTQRPVRPPRPAPFQRGPPPGQGPIIDV